MKSLCRIVLVFLLSLSFLSNAQTFINYNTNDGLPSNSVNGVAVDNSNNIWFATDNGVSKYNGSYFTNYTVVSGLIDDYIYCICVDANDHVWAGTDYGISEYNGSTWTNYSTVNGLPDNSISYICSDNSGGVWIGTSLGLSHYSGSVFTNYSTSSGLPGNMISYLFDDPDGDLWIGTWLTGLAKFDGTTFTTFDTTNNLLDNNILAVIVDDDGNKWVGTYSGISVLDQNDQWVKDYTETSGLYNNRVQDLAFDYNGHLFVGIYADYLQDGAVSFFAENSWASFNMASGLVDEQVKRLAVDNQNNVWITTGNGVSKLKVNNIGYEEIDAGDFNIYPNPASDELCIKMNLSNAELKIFDMSGRLVSEETLLSANNSISVSQLLPGFYSVQLISDDSVSYLPLIVK